MYTAANFAPSDQSRRLRDRIGSFFADLRAYEKARRDLNRLSRMPDYILKDIGLTRGDVRRIRRSPYHHL
jgi:uncharacterized protein YjiS (DUF1127 family)